MFNFKKNSFLLFLSAFALKSCLFVHASSSIGYDSLSIQGDFDDASKASLMNTFHKATSRAERMCENAKNGVYFTKTRTHNFHVSVAVVEPTDTNEKLVESHLATLRSLSKLHLNLRSGYTGHFYNLFLFANGYDAEGNKVRYHYSTPEKAETIKKDKFGFGQPGHKVTHAHIVLRFGTNPTRGADGQPGELNKHATALLSNITKNKDGYGFKDAYEGSEFASHVTVAALKSYVGKVDPSKPALNLDTVLSIYRQIHKSFSQDFSQRDYQLSSFRINGMMTSASGRITLEPLGAL